MAQLEGRPEGAGRSILSVPASNWRMIEKAVASAADVVLLDLEDSVVREAKSSSRANVVRALRELDWDLTRRAYRVNGLDTAFFYRDVIEVVEEAGDTVDLIVVPKVERPEDIVVADTLLRQIEMSAGIETGHPARHRGIRIQAQIETARGLANVEAIARAASRLESLNFGPGDFAASVGMPSTSIGAMDRWDEQYPGHRFHYAMARIVVAARAAGLGAIDGPLADFRDLDAFRASCIRARGLGYDGKWCIHPAQIPIANEVFLPTEEEREWAQRVVDAYTEATAKGIGAVRLDDRMIDEASIRMAQSILAKTLDPPTARQAAQANTTA
jgi:citrate lyase beta subunit